MNYVRCLQAHGFAGPSVGKNVNFKLRTSDLPAGIVWEIVLPAIWKPVLRAIIVNTVGVTYHPCTEHKYVHCLYILYIYIGCHKSLQTVCKYTEIKMCHH